MLYTWNGNDGSYTDATQWTPQGVPLYGDAATALIQSGTVTLSDTRPNDLVIILSAPNAAAQPNLVLDNAALGPSVVLTLIPQGVNGRFPDLGFATITVNGYDTTEARMTLGGSQINPDDLTIAIAPYSQLNQEGTITVVNSSRLSIQGTGQDPATLNNATLNNATLNNDGTINIAGGSAIISAGIVGSGAIAFLPYAPGSGSVELGGAVAATQHIAFNPTSSAQLRIDDPAAFHGILDGFNGTPDANPGSFDKVTLANTQATGTYFAQITPEAGALLVLNGQTVVAALTVTGTHAPDSYGFFNNPDGSLTLA